MVPVGEPSAVVSLPGELRRHSRIPQQTSRSGGVSVQVGPLGDTNLPLAPGDEYAAIRLSVDALDADQALEQVHQVLELVLDDLSFQMQLALPVLQLEVLDVTPPVAVGDERETRLFPFPHGYQQWKFARSTPLGVEVVADVPHLRPNYDAIPGKTQQALDWYIKGLQTQVDADRFIFLWIALEVLEQANPDYVVATYRAKCGHEITTCPTCGKSTARRVAGQSLKAFLEAAGVAVEDAKQLWKMRMLVHGAKSFDPDRLADLGRLLQILRAAVVTILKERLGEQIDQPPIVSHGGPAIAAFALVGSRVLDEQDLMGLDHDGAK